MCHKFLQINLDIGTSNWEGLKMRAMEIEEKHMSEKGSDFLDVYIGQQLKKLRFRENKTLKEIGDMINVSFQQVQKYERGVNKISVSNLYAIANAIGVSIEYFLYKDNNGMEGSLCKNIKHISDSELLTLVKYYSRVENTDVRKNFLTLLKTIVH